MTWYIAVCSERRKITIIRLPQASLTSKLDSRHQARQRVRNRYEEVKFLESRHDGTVKLLMSSRALQVRRTQMGCLTMLWLTWAHPQKPRMSPRRICLSRQDAAIIWPHNASSIRIKINSQATSTLAQATRSDLALLNMTAKWTNLAQSLWKGAEIIQQGSWTLWRRLSLANKFWSRSIPRANWQDHKLIRSRKVRMISRWKMTTVS